jgi:hypothetical protein
VTSLDFGGLGNHPFHRGATKRIDSQPRELDHSAGVWRMF